MKNKRILAFFTALLVSFSIVGCGHDNFDGSATDSPIVTVATTTAASTQAETTVEPTETTAESATETSTKEASRLFDMDETLRSTYLCGYQLSPDLTYGMLSEYFTFDPEDVSEDGRNHHVACGLYYKGEYACTAMFYDCDRFEQITAESTVGSFVIVGKSDDKEHFDVPRISVYGVGFDDSHEKLFDALGDDYTTYNDGQRIVYNKTEDEAFYSFSFSSSGEDRLTIMMIYINPPEDSSQIN